MIVLKNVTKRIGEREVLSSVNLRIEPGELVCITGERGCGKSVLLHLLTGTEAPSTGSVEVDGVDLRKIPQLAMQVYRKGVGMMFQDGKLLPHRTVAENIALPLDVTGAASSVTTRRVRGLLQYLKLDAKADALPEELSDLERTLVAFARAIITKPLILLADAPTAHLKPSDAERVVSLLKEVHAAGTTVIIAMRDSSEALRLGARIVSLTKGKMMETKTSPKASAKEPVDAKGFQRLAVIEQGLKNAQKKVKITAIGSV